MRSPKIDSSVNRERNRWLAGGKWQGCVRAPHRPRVLSVADRRASARFSWSAVRFRSCAAVIHLLSSFQPFREQTLRAGDE